MRHGDLFSGIGGMALAAQWAWGEEYENVFHSEIEKYADGVYHRHFPESKCLGDIREVKWSEGQCDLLTGGFPCQPHSVAGKRKASEDERDLWGECVRALRGIRPKYALFENVPGLLTSERGRFFNRVLADLAASGYDAEWQTISAASIGAPQERKRIWIVAHIASKDDGENPPKSLLRQIPKFGGHHVPENLADNACGTWNYGSLEVTPNGNRKAGTGGENNTASIGGCRSSGIRVRWLPEPDVGRVVNGIPNRVERLRALGNAIVPQVAWVIFEAIKRYDKGNGN